MATLPQYVMWGFGVGDWTGLYMKETARWRTIISSAV